MTNGNPFYVHPGGAYGEGLTGLAGSMMDAYKVRQEQETQQRAAEKFANMKAGAVEAFRSGDPNKMIEFSLQNPEMGQAMGQYFKMQSGLNEAEAQKQQDEYTSALFSWYQNPTEDNANAILEERADLNLPGSDTFVARLKANPEGMKRSVMGELSFFAPNRMKQYHEAMAGPEAGKPTTKIQEYNLAVEQGYKGSFMEYQKKLAEGMGRTKKQKTGAFLVRKPDGTAEIAVGSFDPETGKIKTETAALDGLEVISKLGETAAEETERKIEQKKSELAAAGEEKRTADLIARGIAAAESTAPIRRAITLLDEVKTGGFRAAALRVKQAFGVEGADEGELSNSLGKAVLSQLRETFGAAFTEAEGKRLERIEASFTKSAETNRRLLTQALRIAEKTANRARKKAVEREDQATVDDIDDLLTFTLDEPEKFKSAADMSDEEILKALEQ